MVRYPQDLHLYGRLRTASGTAPAADLQQGTKARVGAGGGRWEGEGKGNVSRWLLVKVVAVPPFQVFKTQWQHVSLKSEAGFVASYGGTHADAKHEGSVRKKKLPISKTRASTAYSPLPIPNTSIHTHSTLPSVERHIIRVRPSALVR